MTYSNANTKMEAEHPATIAELIVSLHQKGPSVIEAEGRAAEALAHAKATTDCTAEPEPNTIESLVTATSGLSVGNGRAAKEYCRRSERCVQATEALSHAVEAWTDVEHVLQCLTAEIELHTEVPLLWKSPLLMTHLSVRTHVHQLNSAWGTMFKVARRYNEFAELCTQTVECERPEHVLEGRTLYSKITEELKEFRKDIKRDSVNIGGQTATKMMNLELAIIEACSRISTGTEFCETTLHLVRELLNTASGKDELSY